jgi:tetratricopeptide (TPR) repeat protein
MRRVLLAFSAIVILFLAAIRAEAQMCQHRGGSSARGMSPYSMNMPFYAPGYANYYPSYYPNNYYPNYYPSPNYSLNSYSLSGDYPSQRGQSEQLNPATSAKAESKLRVSDPKSKAKAEKLLAAGDEAFGKQKYSSAVEQYQSAAKLAPDLAEPKLRQGLALVAQKRYPAAIKAFRRGLEIRRDWTDSPLRLDQLYAEGALAKVNQTLTKAVEAKPANSDLLVALGMQLFFDGQRDRAGTYFARAAGLGANRDRLFDDFMPNPALAEASRDNR